LRCDERLASKVGETSILFNSVLRFYMLRLEYMAVLGSTSLKYPTCRIMIPSKVKNYA
jgi:hypothetical protein